MTDSVLEPFAGGDPGERLRLVQTMVEATRLASGVTVKAIVTPPGEGSPAGLHTHEFDQLFYVVDGEMQIEIDGRIDVARAGSIVVFPAGVAHRNWNAGTATVRHLAFNIPTGSGGPHP